MPDLELLSLTGQRITDYKSFFENVKSIRELELICCNLQNSDTKYMSELTKLERLNLYGTYVTDISFLKNITTLKFVTLPLNVESLDVLYIMPNLIMVNFDAVTELKVTPNLIKYFENNNITSKEATEYIKDIAYGVEKESESILKEMCDDTKKN